MTENDLIKVKKQVRFLTFYATIISVVLILTIAFLFINRKNNYGPSHLVIDEITAKRINIVEPNGQPRLVISNMEKSPENLAYGKPFMPGGNRPGIIFYNDEATECGGLVFTGRTDSSDGKYFSSGHFSFDQYNQNQVLYIQYLDDNGERTTGMYVDDWHNSPPFPQWRSMYKQAQRLPEGDAKEAKLKQLMEPQKGQPAYAHRVFIGKDFNKSAIINLSDKEGKTRIQLIVDSLGAANLNFLDSTGKITYSLPSKKKVTTN
jgi:hypothetical protein